MNFLWLNFLVFIDVMLRNMSYLDNFLHFHLKYSYYSPIGNL